MRPQQNFAQGMNHKLNNNHLLREAQLLCLLLTLFPKHEDESRSRKSSIFFSVKHDLILGALSYLQLHKPFKY